MKKFLFCFFATFLLLYSQIFAENVSDSSKVETILHPDNSANSDSTVKKENKIIIENENDLLIINENDEDILITDDSEEDILFDKKENIPSPSPAISPETEKDPVNGKDNQISSEVVTDEENPEVNNQTDNIFQQQEEEKKVVIEEAKSINFSRNLNEYRSPKKAMFMSLLLPGLGQAYSKKYWKTALFGAIEIGLIGLSAKFIYEGNQEKNQARKFADQNYSVKKFIEFYDNYSSYITALATKDSTDTMDLIPVFHDSSPNLNKKYSASNLANYDSNERKAFDDAIRLTEFVQGWKDCEPDFDRDTGFILDNSNYKYKYKHYYTSNGNDEGNNDTTWLLKRFNPGDTTNALDVDGIYGHSHYQNSYNDMIRTSTGFHDASRNMIFILLTNHVVSAIDAFISARAFNDKLLKKQSIWQNINIDHRIAYTNFGIQSRIGLRVRF